MVTLTNDFHHTSIRLRDRAGRLSPCQVRKAWQALCGIVDCTCGGVAGTRGPQYLDTTPVSGRVWLEPHQDGSVTLVCYF